MNVKQLREKLAEYPDEMEILFCYCSDYERLEADQLGVVTAVDQGHYWMRSHQTMSAENKARMKSYLLFPGN